VEEKSTRFRIGDNMAKERDSQRSRFYRAFSEIEHHTTTLDSMDDVESFIRSMEWKSQIYGRAISHTQWPFRIKDGRGYSRANYVDGYLHFPKRDRDRLTVLRVMAYSVHTRMRSTVEFRQATPSRIVLSGGPWHGWEYCYIVMDLVRHTMGTKVANDLKAAFKKHKVKCKPPMILSPENEAAAKARGMALAELLRDRRKRIQFLSTYPDAVVVDVDHFDDYWETLYGVWK